MIPGQFELDGFPFGGGYGQPVRVEKFEPGDRALLTQDASLPGRPGRMMGRDTDDGPEWTFDLAVESRDGAAVYENLDRLRAAWKGPTDTPGGLSVLRYALLGRVRRVYGRPRRFRPLDVVAWADLTRLPVSCTFQLSDPLHYDDVEQSVSLGVVPASTGGLTFPIRFPWSTARSGAPSARFATVGGSAPAPVRITFHGPVSDPWVRAGGWEVRLRGALAYDRSVTVDTRVFTVLREDGASVAGMLAPRTRLADVRLPPGVHEVVFGGIDQTGTARVELAWRDAWWSL